MSAEGQTSDGLSDLLLCLLELPGVLRGSLPLDLGHSELDQLHWLHKWLTRLKSLLWFPPQYPEGVGVGGLPLLKVGGRQGYVCTVCFISIHFISCHLVDLAVLFSLVQRSVLNCIKCIDCAESWMLHSRREDIPYSWQSKMYKWNSKAKV